MAQTFDEAAALATIRQAAASIQASVASAKAVPREQSGLRYVRRQHELGAAELLAAKAGRDIAAMLLELATPLRSE